MARADALVLDETQKLELALGLTAALGRHDFDAQEAPAGTTASTDHGSSAHRPGSSSPGRSRLQDPAGHPLSTEAAPWLSVDGQ